VKQIEFNKATNTASVRLLEVTWLGESELGRNNRQYWFAKRKVFVTPSVVLAASSWRRFLTAVDGWRQVISSNAGLAAA